jgi:hypothetical protein
MAFVVTRDDTRRRLNVVAGGDVSLQDALDFHSQQVADGTWTYAVLYDGRDRTRTLSSAEARRLEDHMTSVALRHGVPGPLAIVRQDDAGFGVGRMFQTLIDSQRTVAVFRDVTTASAWLDEQLAGSSACLATEPALGARVSDDDPPT